MAFQKIDMTTWARSEHYQYYTDQILTSYQMNIMLDVTKLKKHCKKKQVQFYPAMIYAVMRCINRHENFRLAVDADGCLGVHDVCHPSYTIFHADDQTFSDIWTEWHEDFGDFYQTVLKDMDDYKDVKGVKGKPGRPDAFTPISCVPWITYTGVAHDTPGPRKMYFPIITFGKYEKQGEKWMMPFSIYVNHAAADGYHTSLLLNDIQDMCRHCKAWIN